MNAADRKDLLERLGELIDKLDAHLEDGGPAPDLKELSYRLDEARSQVHLYDLALSEAETKSPHEPAPGWPIPSETGPYMLIMRDRHAAGGLYMRRFNTQDDALAISYNYTADREEWLFEVKREIDLDVELPRYGRFGDGAT